jgi:hypothetical protein
MPQTAGGQQIIFAAAPQPMPQQQKPGQQMITTAQQSQQQGGKTMVPMTMGQATSYTITSTGMAAGGGQQTFMIANPMGGAPLMATPASMAQTQLGGQVKFVFFSLSPKLMQCKLDSLSLASQINVIRTRAYPNGTIEIKVYTYR